MKSTIEVSVRRSPRYSVFLLAGVALGIIAAGVLSVLPVDMSELPMQYSRSSALGILMLVLGMAGAALGGAVALIVDALQRRRMRTVQVQAQYEEVPAPEPVDAPSEPASPPTDSAPDESLTERPRHEP